MLAQSWVPWMWVPSPAVVVVVGLRSWPGRAIGKDMIVFNFFDDDGDCSSDWTLSSYHLMCSVVGCFTRGKSKDHRPVGA